MKRLTLAYCELRKLELTEWEEDKVRPLTNKSCDSIGLRRFTPIPSGSHQGQGRVHRESSGGKLEFTLLSKSGPRNQPRDPSDRRWRMPVIWRSPS